MVIISSSLDKNYGSRGVKFDDHRYGFGDYQKLPPYTHTFFNFVAFGILDD
jgi:hypothetical protein